MRLIVPLIALAGCKYVDSPDRVAALEKRVNTIAADVAELSGGGEEGEHAPAPAAASAKGHGRGADEPTAARPARPAPRRDERDHAADGDALDALDASDTHAVSDPPARRAPAAAHGPAHWGYEGDAGPEHWPALDPAFATCETGEQQSPIDLAARGRRAEQPEIFYIYGPTAAEVVDNGHTLQVNLARGSYAIVDGRRYDLLQFHVHTPSEHTIDGEAMPMEVHLVHKDKTGGLAVVGVLFDEGDRSTALAPMWSAAPRKAGTAKLKRPFDPATLLPKDQRAYRYDGSLTTPPCSEGVEWIVLRRPRSESDDLIAAFRARFGANARPTQPVGGRTVE